MKKIQCQLKVSVMNPPSAGPDERRHAEDGAEEALVLAPLGRREEVADHRQRDREERARAEALDAPEQDQLPHRLASPERTEPTRKSVIPIMRSGLRP